MAYLVKKIERSHVVWFKASNQWVKFDEPQWFIFCLYEKNKSPEEAQKQFCRRYSLPAETGRKTVENVYYSINKLLNPDFPLPDFGIYGMEASRHTLTKKRTKNYLYRGKPFSITYGSPQLQSYVHVPLACLETGDAIDDVFAVELFPFKDRYILRINGHGGRCVSTEEPGQIKHRLYVELAGYFYDKKEDDWMAFIHASAVQKHGETLLLTSTTGSGKSTMAGLLQLHGFDFVSDDFVPLAADDRKAYPFPAALCAKNKAINMLGQQGLEMYPENNEKIAYAKPSAGHEQIKPAAVKKMVFIKYNPATGLLIRPVSTLDALVHFHREAWVGDDMNRAEMFMDWFEKLEFYRLEYGDNEKAVDSINNLMSRE